MSKYLIVGGSVGAIGAVEAIREIDPDGTITNVSREGYQAYSRPMISEYLAHKASLAKMHYRPPDFYDNCKVDLRAETAVLSIDAVRRTARLADGAELEWEQLLLATGSTPILPAIDGVDKNGVFTFTTVSDAQAIDAAIVKGARVATVVGGGLIGVSAADALVERGLKVTVVELLDRLLGLSVDQQASLLVAEAMRRMGVEVIVGRSVVTITGHSSTPNAVGGVILDDGRHIMSDIVIMAVGVKPSVQLAKDAGIATARGILVDRRMATSSARVFACGDAAEAPSMFGERKVIPLWPLAYMGGRTAGTNMAGGQAEYIGGINLSTIKYFGVRLVAAGVVNAEQDGELEVLANSRKGNYRKVVLCDGKVMGFVFANDIERSGLVFGLMRDGVDVSNFQNALVADSFGLVALPTELRQQMYTVVTGGVT